MTMTFYVEVALEILLAATLGYCILLERRLPPCAKARKASAAPSAGPQHGHCRCRCQFARLEIRRRRSRRQPG